MIILVLELIKISAWIVILSIALYWHRKISVNVFWLTVIGASLMIVATIHDIFRGALEHNSVWWLVASLFVLVHYYTLLIRSKRFYNVTNEKLTNFVNRIEEDTRNLIREKDESPTDNTCMHE